MADPYPSRRGRNVACVTPSARLRRGWLARTRRKAILRGVQHPSELVPRHQDAPSDTHYREFAAASSRECETTADPEEHRHLVDGQDRREVVVERHERSF